MKRVFMWLGIVAFGAAVGILFNHHYPLPTEESGIQYVHDRGMTLLFTVLFTALTILAGFVIHFRWTGDE